MEAEVALHVMAADPGLRVAVPWRPTARFGDPPVRRGRETRWASCGPSWSRRRRGALGPALRRPARAQPDRGGAAERCRAHRLGRDDGPARPGAARLHPPPSAPRDAVGRPARPRLAGDARRHPRTAAARAGGSRPGRVRADGDAGVAAAARPGRPHRPVGRQHRDRRRRVHHRRHRLRRHEPHGVDHRARIGARLTGSRPRGRRALPPGPARPRRLPAAHRARGLRARRARPHVGGPQRGDDRHQLVAGGPGTGGAGLRRALQRRVRADADDDGGRRLARGGAAARGRRAGRAGSGCGAPSRRAGPRSSVPRWRRCSTTCLSRSRAPRACGSPTPRAGATSTSTTTSRASATAIRA